MAQPVYHSSSDPDSTQPLVHAPEARRARSTPATSKRLGLNRSLDRDQDYYPLQVDGTIPASLQGTLLRCGPAVYQRPSGERITHPFDGLGAVTGIRLSEGKA